MSPQSLIQVTGVKNGTFSKAYAALCKNTTLQRSHPWPTVQQTAFSPLHWEPPVATDKRCKIPKQTLRNQGFCHQQFICG